MQYDGGCSVERSKTSVQQRHTVSAEEDVQFGFISTDESVQYRVSKTTQRVVGGRINWENDILKTIQL